MASKKNKLELTWIGMDNRPRLEPRILIEEPEFSHHAQVRREGDIFGNMLIQGDNLLALKTLETNPAVRGKVKCVFIDPPYNTGSAFEYYDDSIEHSLWLSMMRERLEILKNIMAKGASIWVTIDDWEVAYFRVLMDEVFGRSSLIATAVWQKRYSRENLSTIGDAHDYVLIYAPNPDDFKLAANKTPIDEKSSKVYKNPNNDPKGRWRGVPMTAQGYRPNQMYKITTPAGVEHLPPEGRCWSTTEE